jgi:predicted ester cyclase
VSVEENQAAIRRLFDEVYNGHNLDVIGELVAEDVVNHSATDEHKHGIGGFRHVMKWGAALMPDGRYELLDTIAEGDMFACRVRVSGTMRGELFGVPPTGKSATFEHVHWHRVSGGKLVERWAARDDLEALIHFGIIDPPGRFEADSPDYRRRHPPERVEGVRRAARGTQPSPVYL